MGLGFALAKELVHSGFAVALCARDESRLHAAVSTLSQVGLVIGLPGDVTDPTFQEAFIAAVVDKFGRVDALVNNASVVGDLPMPSMDQTSVENLRKVFEVNAFAPISLLQQALPYLNNAPKSLAISISSDAALGGYPGWGVYGASKAALDLLTKTFASEQSHIACYAIDPSDMDTAMHHAASPGDEGLNQPKDVATTIYSLFEHLQTDEQPPFPSGTRLQVQGKVLAVREVN